MVPDFPLFPERASTLAGQVDELFLFALGISVFFSLLIAGLLAFFMVRYKRRRHDEIGAREKESNWLEIAWSVIPLLILLFMFAWGAKVFFIASRPPAEATEYYAVGKRWMWKMQHPEGNREINELHVPVNRPIKITLTSEDVIHSFFVPAFRVKADALPGRYTTVWFEATKTGRFKLFCAEYCGAEHSQMIGEIIVMEPHEYEEWLIGNRPDKSLAQSGAELFEAKSCNTCHRPDSDARAPILHDLAGKQVALLGGDLVEADDQYLRESIVNPQAKVVAGYQPIMPTYQSQLSEEQILDLIAYIKSLRRDAGKDAPAAESSSGVQEG